MGRIARVVVPGLPHHVTQRGNRRLLAFFQDDDYRLYLDLLAEECRRHEVAIWAYSLMPNHSHLVPVPLTEVRLLGRPDPLLTLEPLQSMIDDWPAFLFLPLEGELLLRLRLHARTGRPLGSEAFLRQLEEQTGLTLLPQPRGRPRVVRGDTNG
jgi:hypothetical protein